MVNSLVVGEYRSLASEVRLLANTFQDIQDVVNERGLNGSNGDTLGKKSQDCKELLGDLDALVTKYNSLPLQSKRTWERIGWEEQEGEDVRARLTGLVEGFQDFYESLSQNSQVQIEQALEQLAAEIRNGRADATSVVTLGTADSSNSDPSDDSGWAQVVHDLKDLGISETIAAENRTFIVEWILRAINLGWLDEKIPATELTTPVGRTPSPMERPPFAPKALSPIQSTSSPAQSTPAPPYLSPESWAANHQRISAHDMIPNDDLRAVGGFADDSPPSPIEPEEPETNLIWTAQKIVTFWNQREWAKARENLEQQLRAVRRGQTIVMNGKVVAPDIRILQHLIGVSYSFQGDFIRAKEVFQSVLQGVYVSGMPLDDGDIAAARWLGETCIQLNECMNASLAWAIALCGSLSKFGPQTFPSRFMSDLRLLNQFTFGLANLKNSFVRSNRDATTILGRMAGIDKYQVVLSALEQLGSGAYSMYTENETYYRHVSRMAITIAEGFLVQPLVSQTSWPLQQDPFFRAKNSISLLTALSKPKKPFPYDQVPTLGGLGQAKSLIYSTKNSLEWLVENVRIALSTYAIEWKISGPMFLCRLSHSYDHIAYYECYGVKVRKLPLRSVYGIKLTEKLYSTRGFIPSLMLANGEEQERGMPNDDEAKRLLVIKTELGDRLRDFLQEAEKAKAQGRKFPPDMYLPPKAPYEMGGTPMPKGAELHSEALAELPGRQWEPREMDVQEIAELPAEPYR